MNKIPIDLYAYICKFIPNPSDLLALKITSTNFNKEIKKTFIVKIILEKALKTPYTLSEVKKIKHNLICTNADCRIYPIFKNTLSYCMGITNFYYPDNEDEYIDEITCLKAPIITRFIPYCFDCMLEYVEYGCKPNNPYSVPFGKNSPEFFL